MCRSIELLFNVEPHATDEEIRAASLQFIRKVSGMRKPSKANEAAFLAAVDAVAAASSQLLHALEATGAPKDRAQLAERKRSRSARRFPGAAAS